MSAVVAEAAVSLDGFVAFPDDTVGPLFDWYSNGEVALARAIPSGSSTRPRPARTTCGRRGRGSGRP